MPDQKVGIEIPISANPMMPASTPGRLLIAASTPSVIPNAAAVRTAVIVSVRVDGR